MSPNLLVLAPKYGILGDPAVRAPWDGRTGGHPTCGFPTRAGTEPILMSFPRVPTTARIWASTASLKLGAKTSPERVAETQRALATPASSFTQFSARCSSRRRCSSPFTESRRPTANSKANFKSRRRLRGRRRSSLSPSEGGGHAFMTITSLPSGRSTGGATSALFSTGFLPNPRSGADTSQASRGPRPTLVTP